MSAEALFGEGQERAAFEDVAVEHAEAEQTAQDNLTPVTPVTFTIFVCPVLTYQFDC